MKVSRLQAAKENLSWMLYTCFMKENKKTACQQHFEEWIKAKVKVNVFHSVIPAFEW